MAIHEILTAPRSPWQNAYVERCIGSVRLECLDHILVGNERGLHRVLKAYVEYYLRSRTHLALDNDAPMSRPVAPPADGRIVAIPQLSGLHHRDERRAAYDQPHTACDHTKLGATNSRLARQPETKNGDVPSSSCTYRTVERPSPSRCGHDAPRADAGVTPGHQSATAAAVVATSVVPTGAGFRRRRTRRTAQASDAPH